MYQHVSFMLTSASLIALDLQATWRAPLTSQSTASVAAQPCLDQNKNDQEPRQQPDLQEGSSTESLAASCFDIDS
jgi:hypothetical protein